MLPYLDKCPFCGEHGKFQTYYENRSLQYIRVECSKCHASPADKVYIGDADTVPDSSELEKVRSSLADKWNERKSILDFEHREALDYWFGLSSKVDASLGTALKKCLAGYLRTCCSGGMETRFATKIQNIIDHFLDTSVGPLLARFQKPREVMSKIADAYDRNELDDEARKFSGYNDIDMNTNFPKEDIILYTGRGGKTLLTLQDCVDARNL